MRFVALILSLVGLLVAVYALAVAAPEHSRAEREWFASEDDEMAAENARLRMRGMQARLQLVAVIAIGSSIMGLILGLVTRKHDGGPQPTLAIIAGLAGLVAGLIAGFGDRMF